MGLGYVSDVKEIPFEVKDWPEEVSIFNPVNKICWGREWCEANFFTVNGDEYGDSTLDVPWDCQEIPTEGLTMFYMKYFEYDTTSNPNEARWPDNRWRLN